MFTRPIHHADRLLSAWLLHAPSNDFNLWTCHVSFEKNYPILVAINIIYVSQLNHIQFFALNLVCNINVFDGTIEDRLHRISSCQKTRARIGKGFLKIHKIPDNIFLMEVINIYLIFYCISGTMEDFRNYRIIEYLYFSSADVTLK